MKNSTQTTLPHFNFSVTAELNDVTSRLIILINEEINEANCMVRNIAKLDRRTKQHNQFGVSMSDGSRDMARTKSWRGEKNERGQNHIASPTGIAKYDSHTLCSHRRDVVCSLTTCCTECQDWSVEIMSEYLKHKKSLTTKRGKMSATAASSGSSQPAVASSPLLGSPPRFPSISDDDKIRDAILSVLQNCLSQVV